MALHTSLRTIDLARATGISVQQVRNYEFWGLLPPTSRMVISVKSEQVFRRRVSNQREA
jgi:hypothetical protein